MSELAQINQQVIQKEYEPNFSDSKEFGLLLICMYLSTLWFGSKTEVEGLKDCERLFLWLLLSKVEPGSNFKMLLLQACKPGNVHLN